MQVLTGKDAGKRGTVLRVVPTERRIVVEKLNMVKRHTKPRPRRAARAASRSSPAACSSARRRCRSRTWRWCARPAASRRRVGYRMTEDGNKVRVCRKCGKDIDR